MEKQTHTLTRTHTHTHTHTQTAINIFLIFSLLFNIVVVYLCRCCCCCCCVSQGIATFGPAGGYVKFGALVVLKVGSLFVLNIIKTDIKKSK